MKWQVVTVMRWYPVYSKKFVQVAFRTRNYVRNWVTYQRLVTITKNYWLGIKDQSKKLNNTTVEYRSMRQGCLRFLAKLNG